MSKLDITSQILDIQTNQQMLSKFHHVATFFIIQCVLLYIIHLHFVVVVVVVVVNILVLSCPNSFQQFSY